MSEHIATVEWQLAEQQVVRFSGAAPSAEEHAKLHEKAHQRCFIANSVKTRIILEPGIA